MSQCVFPGSFDPPTIGHMDLIRRAACIFDRVIVTVMVNISKECVFPYEERVNMLRKICRDIPNTEVTFWNGLLADFIRQKEKQTVVVRGIRNSSELDLETTAAAVNRKIFPGMETVLIPASGELTGYSSSAVREIARFRGDYRFLIPECIIEDVDRYLKKYNNN